MAEARADEEEERRVREPGHGGARRSAAEHSDRNKPDQRHSSAGPLSSIRAAIKRTSRTSSQSEHPRDRRRPEITILSAEPLPSNTWFPGASGAFPPAPPPAPPSWSATSGTVQLPPPSYEQVIKEKTREQNLHSTSSSSSSSPPPCHCSTSTIATQTDTNSPDPQSPAARSGAVRKPPKPPRPSLPLKQTSPPTDAYINQPQGRDVQTDFDDVASDITLLDSAPTAFTPDSVKGELSVRPRPRPRSRASSQPIISEEILDLPMTREVKVQTLVRLRDDGPENAFAGFSDGSSNFSSKYLQDLLEVFGSEEVSDQQSYEEKEEETVISTIRSEEPLNRPQPRPRTQKPKPQLAPKPSILESEGVSKPNLSSSPVAAPRPLLNKHHSPSHPSRVSLSEITSPEHQIKALRSSEHLINNSTTSPEKTAVNPSDKNIINRPSVSRHTRPPPPLHRSVSSTSQVSAVTVTGVCVATAASVPPLPPRPSGGGLLPLRPPPIKMTKPTGPASSTVSANQLPDSKVPKRGPPLPPRPKPGHPLYKSCSRKVQESVEVENAVEPQEEPFSPEEEQLIVLNDTGVLQTHPDLTAEVKGEDTSVYGDLQEESCADVQTHSRCVAQFAFSGEEGELTFSDGDVITLIEYVNEEWGRGCLNGQIGIFPLNFIKEETEALPRKPALASSGAGGRNRGRALYDFSPECEDELCLKAGDVVCDLEDMDAEWFLGELGGKRGIIPKNYIQVLPEP